MTTPYAQQGGFVNNLLGGVAGTLAGTNPLQSSIDQLTNAVNRLSTQMSAGGRTSTRQQANGNGSAGNAAIAPFPRPYNPFQPPGGGPAGNVSPSMPFGRFGAGLAGGIMLGGAFAGYGQQQMPFQLGLNAMASMSMMGTGYNMGQYGGFANSIGNQPGMPLSSSPMDFLSMMQSLQFLGGTPRYMGSALGRAGFGAASAFGMTNPTLSGAASGSLAQQIYNPMLSMRMRLLGYNMTPRVMGSGMPQTIGNIASSMISTWYGTNKVSPSQLFRTLSMGGKGFANLQYLGLNPQQMAPLLEGFNKLFNAGYSPEAASNLFSQAASNNPSVSGRAQAALRNAGVSSVTSDLQKLKNNQSTLTQRSVNTAAGFNAALTTATDSLKEFNQTINNLLTSLHLNGALGAAGGFAGVMAGTNHGNFLGGLGGIGLLGLALRGGLGAGGLGGLGGLGGAAGGILSKLGLGGVGLSGALGAGAAIYGVNNIHVGNKSLWQLGNPVAGQRTGWNSWSGLGRNIGNWWDNLFGGSGASTNGSGMNGRLGNMPNVGGGATSAPVPTSGQQGTRGSTMSSISSSAFKAVTAAESQLGVPYVWGGEQPGVGFDCSGLIQWAYKQAGVALPRTSEQQWAALRRRSVPTNAVQEGDLVFMAGSDGTPNKPGHVGMMINKSQLIEAPTTGQDVKIIGYDPRQWSHAARPSGRTTNAISGGVPGQNIGASALGLYGNAGVGMGIGNYGSANEVDLISATGGFMGGGMGAFSLGGLGGLMSTGGQGSTGKTTGNLGPRGNGSRAIAAEKAYAMQLLRARGWGSQFGALNSIINAESGWRWNAANASGAYGIPQALPGDKMSAAGRDWRTNPDTQLRWMIDMYIPKTYGNPNNAWAFHQQHGWYSTGGWNLPPGFKMVGERGPELMFTGRGTGIMSNSQSMALMKAINTQPTQSPWQAVSGQMQYGGEVITPGKVTSKGANGINISFGAKSICVTIGSNSSGANSAHDAQSVGSHVAKSIVAHLEQELLFSTIAQGIKG